MTAGTLLNGICVWQREWIRCNSCQLLGIEVILKNGLKSIEIVERLIFFLEIGHFIV